MRAQRTEDALQQQAKVLLLPCIMRYSQCVLIQGRPFHTNLIKFTFLEVGEMWDSLIDVRTPPLFTE